MKNIYKGLILFALIGVLSCCNNPKPADIWMVGDSTMAWKKPSRNPESGWGEGMKLFVNEYGTIHNHAASGRSTLSFITEGRWKNVCDSLKSGDFVIIQFGHNDEKTNPKLYTIPYGTFSENLKMFIDQSRDKGAIPVVCSSIVRRQFDKDGQLIDTHGDYIAAACTVAKATNTPYIDMENLTRTLVTNMGPEKSKEIYNFTSRKQDSTHVNHKGAEVIARLFVDEVKKQKLPLDRYFK